MVWLFVNIAFFLANFVVENISMKYLFIAIIAIFIGAPVLLAAGKLKDDNKAKAYTDVTAYMGVSIFTSVFISIAIALNADMSPSIGHGGFIYIIGPSTFGFAILIFYVALIPFKPSIKFVAGMIGVAINLFVGLLYYSGFLP